MNHCYLRLKLHLLLTMINRSIPADPSEKRTRMYFRYTYIHIYIYIYMQSLKQCALLVITTMTLWQLMHLGTWCMSCHKVTMVITGRANFSHDFMIAYRFHSSCFCEIWAFCVLWIMYDHLYIYIYGNICIYIWYIYTYIHTYIHIYKIYAYNIIIGQL